MTQNYHECHVRFDHRNYNTESHWLAATTLVVVHSFQRKEVMYLLCRYRKRTDIYYSTWRFENVAKICQFQFLDPPPPTH